MCFALFNGINKLSQTRVFFGKLGSMPISIIDMNIILIFLDLRPCWMAPNAIDLYYRMYGFCFETKFLRLKQKLPKISFFKKLHPFTLSWDIQHG